MKENLTKIRKLINEDEDESEFEEDDDLEEYEN